MDKLVIATGVVCLVLGLGFIVAHQMAPSLSIAYLSGGAASVGIGVVILIASKMRARKAKELLR
ncbi:MAG TPA: hypothetical protein VD699_06020 [Nitrosopumilaceae archaeon]|nr:hypothetical protein [Nitrosopumilaceae archaeon]